MITRPGIMSFQDWSDAACLDLNYYGLIGKFTGGNWQDWAVQICNTVTIGKNIPFPYTYSDWRDWAERVCEIMA